ncbi:MAG: hypothetical protein ACPL3B_07885, partial [Fervidobacterium sp.]
MEGRVKIETPKKSLLDLKPIEFEVEKEVWNRYRLEDDAILKTKFVLINVFAEKAFEEKVERIKKGEKNVKVDFEFQSSNVVGVTVPPNLIGEPSNQQYPLQELEASVV